MTPALLAFITQTTTALIAAVAAIYAARVAVAARGHAEQAAANSTAPEDLDASLSAIRTGLDQVRRTQAQHGRMLHGHINAHAAGQISDTI